MALATFTLSAPLKLGLLAVASVGALSGLSFTSTGQHLFTQIGIADAFARTSDVVAKTAQNSSNAVQAFLGRSPGERGATDMLKGKVRPSVAENAKDAKGPTPSQRALGKIFDEPLQSLAGPISPAPAIAFLPLDAGNSAAALPATALPLPLGSGIFAPVVGGGFIGGGGGGSPGGGGGNGGPGGGGDVIVAPAPPPIATAVPEPSTWLLLLIGFAAVGASVRRQNAGKVSALKRAGHCATA